MFHLLTPQAERVAPALRVAVGMVLPLFFGAVQLLPAAEVLANSVRNVGMTPEELRILPGTVEAVLEPLLQRGSEANARSVTVLGSALALAALAVPRVHRRAVFFFACTGVLAFLLVFDSPLLRLYQALPVIGTLRGPSRLLWITAFAATVLVGFGVAALVDARTRLPALGLYAVAVVALHGLGEGGLRLWDWGLALAPLPFLFWPASIAAAPARGGWLGPAALCAALVLTFWQQHRNHNSRWLPDEERLWEGRAAFEFVAAQEPGRVFAHPIRTGYLSDKALLNKTPGLYGLPSSSDYEHLTSRRYADLQVWLSGQRDVESVTAWMGAVTTPQLNQPLLDLLGVRWIVTHGGNPPGGVKLTERWREDGWAVFENPTALPRAYYVPRAVVVEDRDERLDLLASGAPAVREIVVLEEATGEGLLSDGAGEGSVILLQDHSEVLRLRVDASHRGFVVLGDQYSSAWSAQLNGKAVPVLRANHAMRAVRVPSGASEIEFRFCPYRFYVGAGLSLLSLAGAVCWLRGSFVR